MAALKSLLQTKIRLYSICVQFCEFLKPEYFVEIHMPALKSLLQTEIRLFSIYIEVLTRARMQSCIVLIIYDVKRHEYFALKSTLFVQMTKKVNFTTLSTYICIRGHLIFQPGILHAYFRIHLCNNFVRNIMVSLRHICRKLIKLGTIKLKE